MHDPVPPDLHTRVRQAFLLGLARNPVAPMPSLTGLLPPGGETALALLALTGQRQRFAGPPPVAADDVPDAARSLHADPRPILPADARRALRRLIRSAEKSTVLSIALRRVSAAGCRLHPFDLPDLARHIDDESPDLGIAERAWLALTASDPGAGAEDPARFFDRMTTENWTTFPKAQRRVFVADLRRKDSAEGRALVESVWKSEHAAVRAALLEGLATGLCADDRPFIEKLATDRADRVKQVAQSLLARMPASESQERRIAAAARCFKRAGSGAGRLMAALGIGGGETVSLVEPTSPDGRQAQDQLFTGVPLAAVAAAVGVTPAEIVTAVPPERRVLWNLLESALSDGDGASVQCIVTASVLARPTMARMFLSELAWAARGPLDRDAAARLLAPPAWQETLDSLLEYQVDLERIALLATLMPREAIPSFVASLDAVPPPAARAARDFTDLILALPANPLPEPAP